MEDKKKEGKEEISKRELKYVSLCKILASSMLEEKTSWTQNTIAQLDIQRWMQSSTSGNKFFQLWWKLHAALRRQAKLP